MTKHIEINLSDLNGVHQYLRKNARDVFAEERRKAERYNKIMQFSKLSIENMEKYICTNYDSTFSKYVEHYPSHETSPIIEFLLNVSPEYAYEFEELRLDERNIWDISPAKIADIFKRIGMTYSELVRRIENQYIHVKIPDSASVMARSENASAADFTSAQEQMYEQFEIKKKEQFLKQLEPLLK